MRKPAFRFGMWSRVWRNALGAPAAWVASAGCYNCFRPLHVVWDLDETLVSSERRSAADKKPCKEMVISLKAGAEVEHLDDDGLHYITRARPHAMLVLGMLRLLPGVQQHVSTSATP